MSRGGKYNHILATFCVEIKAKPSAVLAVHGAGFSLVLSRFAFLSYPPVHITPVVVVHGVVRVKSDGFGEVTDGILVFA